jgi:CDP-paratose 2-epimerase
MQYVYSKDNRVGDHIWWISDVSKFRDHYPSWDWEYGLIETLTQMHTALSQRA